MVSPSPSHHYRDRIPLASSPAVRNKLTNLLQYALRGVRDNPTATARPLMLWVQSTLREGVEAVEAAKVEVEGAAQAAARVEGGDGKKKGKAAGAGEWC